jgi:cytoskeletal protein RodZ
MVTRIGLHFLCAIEADEFAKLPGGLYNTSYIRQYARAVGYDEAELLQHYHCLTRPKPTDEIELPHGRFSEWVGGHPIRSFVHHVWVKRKGQHAA